MKAYKATINMKCRDITYEVGKTYTFNGELVMCSQGFHFCERMEDVLYYYDYNNDFVLMEIDVIGKVISKDVKSITDKFTVTKVIPKEEYSEALGITFDEDGNVVKLTHPNSTQFIYSNGKIVHQIDKFGRKSTYEYDENGNRIKSILQNGDILICEYDKKGNLTKEISPNGRKTIWEYDTNGNKIKTIFPDGEIYTFEYDEKGNKTKETLPNGYTHVFEYDNKGNKIKEVSFIRNWSITIE